MPAGHQPQEQDGSSFISGSSGEVLPPLRNTSTGSIPWDKIVSEMNVESRELRSATEKRAQRIVTMEDELRKLVDHNAGVMLAIERVDRQIEEVLKREKRLHHLSAAAKKRKARLQLELEESERELATLAEYDSQAKTVSVTLMSPAQRSVMDNEKQLETDRINKEKNEVAELQRKLYDAKSRHRKVCVENKKIMNTLSSMRAEENEITKMKNENSAHNNSSDSENRIGLRIALQDLLNSLEEVIDAGRRSV
ncbi:hypothetical protein LSM04_007723 [Trypanosoma melophagium]|uniref:uncharacterized protein n=1 Tax=Trypanosoma melophagium TaxID=715481 RepID=UPI00351A7B9A|nr:hypothetical protein LSM04_007723 [Trypanosoma melophagium]